MSIDEDLKSFDPAIFTDPPDAQWGVADLGRYARAQDEAIAAGEKALSPIYWRLGLALNLARKQFAHGQWTRYLREHEIDKTRAARARAIHGTFETEQQVAELSVEAAYRRRKKKPRTTTATKPDVSQPPPGVIEFLLSVCQQADRFAEQAEYLPMEQAAAIVMTIEETIAELVKLRDRFSDNQVAPAI